MTHLQVNWPTDQHYKQNNLFRPHSSLYNKRILLKMVHTRSLFRSFFVFQTNITSILLQINVKNVHPVYGAGVRTHNLQIVSVIPQPLVHGFCPTESIFKTLSCLIWPEIKNAFARHQFRRTQKLIQVVVVDWIIRSNLTRKPNERPKWEFFYLVMKIELDPF